MKHELRNKYLALFAAFALMLAPAAHVYAENGNETDTETEQEEEQPSANQQLLNGAQDTMNNAVTASQDGANANAESVDNTGDEGQEDAQKAATKNKSQGSKMATLLGIGLLAAGGIMLATGQMKIGTGNGMIQKGGDLAKFGKSLMSNPMSAAKGAAMVKDGTALAGKGTEEVATGEGLSKMGLFTLAGGGAALLVGQMMGKNAGQSAGYQSNLGDFPGYDPSTNPGFNVDDGTGGDGSGGNGPGGGTGNSGAPGGGPKKVTINPTDLQNGTLGEIMDKFEAETGLSRLDFAKGVAAGIPIEELLQGQGGLSKEQIRKGIDVANAASNFGNEGGLGSSMFEAAQGANLGDLVSELQAKIDEPSDDDLNYSGGSRGLASAGKPAPKKFDFNSLKDPGTVKKKFDAAKVNFDDLSEQVRNQLLKEGRSGKSLFDMISTQYRKKTPMLFGENPDVQLEGKYNLDMLDDENAFNEI